MVKLKVAVIVLLTSFIYALPIIPKDSGSSTPTYPAQETKSQGWTMEDRQLFYHTSQGTRIFPYRWLIALEEPSILSKKPFLSDERVRRFHLIPDPDTNNNPDRLPVGLAKEVSPEGEFISITCAACHTGQISFKGSLIRIDGGPAMHNLNGFFADAFLALTKTSATVLKFRRFAKKVLGERDSLAERNRLRVQVLKVLEISAKMLAKDKLKNLFPTKEGFGRLDALGRGGNLILGIGIGDDDNLVVANAPVSYPHLWGTPFFDWVQWNGSIQQPMGRNIAEALGVNTPVTLKDVETPANIFKSGVRIENLHLLEKTLQKLEPPRWPEEILGHIDRNKAARGETLYAQHCAECHESKPNEPNKFGKVFLHIKTYPLGEIGTDPTAAVNFNKRFARTGQLGQPPINLPATLSAVEALKAVTTKVAERKYAELHIPPEMQDEMNGFRANEMRAPLEYRARNMDGIWATAPYLHNNSVPNLYQLLLPAANRDKRFYVGNLEYDPRTVGFQTGKFPEGFELLTNITGNSNAGHEFRDGPRRKGVIGPLLNDEERWAIIEYLKTR
jgi:cytochrome c2